MKNILNIAIKDIRQTLRDKLTFLFLLIMPVVFTLLFGFAFGGLGGKSDPRPLVAYNDQDHSAASAALKGLLETSVTMRSEDRQALPADLQQQVADQKLAAAIVVPAGYGASLQAGTALRLDVYVNGQNDSAARAEIQRAAARLASAAQAARAIQQTQAGSGVSQDASFDELLTQTAAAWANPPLRLAVTSRAAAANPSNASQGALALSNTAPGMMIQFAIAGLMTAAQVLVSERKSRCMQRLLTTAVARHEILLGHFLAIFATIFVQISLLVAFGQFILKLDYLRQPLATLIMMVSTALFVAALGLLVGSLAKSDDQAVIFAMIPMFVFSALGGAWLPLDMTGQTFQLIGHLSPVAWAMDGFKAIIARGLDLNAIWLPAGALLGYAVLFFTLAVWKFKFE